MVGIPIQVICIIIACVMHSKITKEKNEILAKISSGELEIPDEFDIA